MKDCNSTYLDYLRKQKGKYYAYILDLAEKLAEVREIKVLDLLGVQLSYRGTLDNVTVIYNVNKNRVKVYKFIEDAPPLLVENTSVNRDLSPKDLAEVLLSLDKVW